MSIFSSPKPVPQVDTMANEKRLEAELLRVSHEYAKTKWGAWFDNALWNLIDSDQDADTVRKCVKLAREVTDSALEEYEARWGITGGAWDRKKEIR